MLNIRNYVLSNTLSLILGISSSVYSVSFNEFSAELQNAFTLNGQIPVTFQSCDFSEETPINYPAEIYNINIQKAMNRDNNFLGETDSHLYHALDDLLELINDKEVALIGTRMAWYESILLAYGATPIVIDENPVLTGDPRVVYLTPEQCLNESRQFDLVLSLINTAHDGLGSDGKAIDPDGDLKSMGFYKKILTPTGKLLLSVPVGIDELVWNSHRVYGQLRLKMLLKGWKILRYYGFTSEHVFFGINFQPVFLLQSK